MTVFYHCYEAIKAIKSHFANNVNYILNLRTLSDWSRIPPSTAIFDKIIKTIRFQFQPSQVFQMAHSHNDVSDR